MSQHLNERCTFIYVSMKFDLDNLKWIYSIALIIMKSLPSISNNLKIVLLETIVSLNVY